MRRAAAALVFLLGLSSACLAGPGGSGAGAPQSEQTAGSQQHFIRTVFLVVMENHNWTRNGSKNIKGNVNAPYINYTLLPMASRAENYWNPPRLHPSLPNYLWLEAGTNFGIYNDGPATKYRQTTHKHLVALLDKAGVSWRSYEEGASGTDCPLTSWHDPFVFFEDETNDEDPHSDRCIWHVRPYTELKSDLERSTVARYNLIVPNLCDSMHNTCGGDAIAHGDAWLQKNIPLILNSDAYRSGGALFITWDEAARGNGPIPMLVLSPFAKGNGYANYGFYNHGSTLRTLEEIFGVGPMLGDAAKQHDLSGLFTVFP